jgi:hypothetical protein
VPGTRTARGKAGAGQCAAGGAKQSARAEQSSNIIAHPSLYSAPRPHTAGDASVDHSHSHDSTSPQRCSVAPSLSTLFRTTRGFRPRFRAFSTTN